MKFNIYNARGGRPTRAGGFFKKVFSCLLSCFKHPDDVTEELDLAESPTPYCNGQPPSTVSDESSCHNLPRGWENYLSRQQQQPTEGATNEDATPINLRKSTASQDSRSGRIQQQETPNGAAIDDETSINLPSSGAAQATDEIDITTHGGLEETEEEGHPVDPHEPTLDLVEGNGNGSTNGGGEHSQAYQQMVLFSSREVSLPRQAGPTGGRVSRDSDEMEELEKVERWQRGRAVLGNNNLLRHKCHPGAPRRRGIFDFYNQQYSLVGRQDEMSSIIFSGPL